MCTIHAVVVYYRPTTQSRKLSLHPLSTRYLFVCVIFPTFLHVYRVTYQTWTQVCCMYLAVVHSLSSQCYPVASQFWVYAVGQTYRQTSYQCFTVATTYAAGWCSKMLKVLAAAVCKLCEGVNSLSVSGLQQSWLLRPGRGAEYCHSHVSELHGWTSPVFCMLNVFMARSSSGCISVRYVLLVLWMTSFST